jgi:hypothetical protein
LFLAVPPTLTSKLLLKTIRRDVEFRDAIVLGHAPPPSPQRVEDSKVNTLLPLAVPKRMLVGLSFTFSFPDSSLRELNMDMQLSLRNLNSRRGGLPGVLNKMVGWSGKMRRVPDVILTPRPNRCSPFLTLTLRNLAFGLDVVRTDLSTIEPPIEYLTNPPSSPPSLNRREKWRRQKVTSRTESSRNVEVNLSRISPVVQKYLPEADKRGREG